MTAMWRNMIKPNDVDVVAPDGSVRCRVKAYYSGKQFIIDDMAVDVRPGDEIRRLLPNGNEEAFVVEDPKFFNAGRVAPHYQIVISRRGNFPRHSGGNYSVNVSGANSRVNIGSTDNSTNTITGGSFFGDLRHAINNGIADEGKRSELTAYVGEIEKATNQRSFLTAYQGLISTAADHVTVLTPFLPALMEMVIRLAP